MAGHRIEQGMGPDYRIHTYDKIHEPPVYRPYNSNYTYNRIHSYDHVHSYDKVHQYNQIKYYDHIHEWNYRDYKPKYKSNRKRKRKSERQWEYVPTEVDYYKEVWPELSLCYKMPMGPEIRVSDYTYKEYTPTSFRPRYFSYEEIKTDCAKYMNRPYKEYKRSEEYKLTKLNFHPFVRYTRQEKRQKTVMKKKYKDENQNIIDNPDNTNKMAVAAVVIPTVQTQEKQKVLTPHNTPSQSPSQAITPVEISSVVIDSPVTTQRDESHNIIPVMAAVPMNKEQIESDKISDIQEESEIDIDEFEESDTEGTVDSPKPTGIIGAAAICSNIQNQSQSEEKTHDDDDDDDDDDDREDDGDDDDELSVPEAAVLGAGAAAVASGSSVKQNTSKQEETQKSDESEQQNKNQDPEQDKEPDIENDVNPAPVIAAAVVSSGPDTKQPKTEQDKTVEGGASNTDDVINKKSSLPPEVVAAIEAYDVAHSELKVPNPYSATGTISRTIGMMK